MKIRGIFLSDYVQTVRATPDLEWDRYLAAEDWEIIRGTIIPTEWYPAQTMGRIGRGLFEMRAGKNYEAVRTAGRIRAVDSFDEASKKFLLRADPLAGLRFYVEVAKRYVDEIAIKLEHAEPGQAKISFYPVDDAPSWDLFREIQAGTMEQIVGLNGGPDARAEFISEIRGGREACIIKITWSVK